MSEYIPSWLRKDAAAAGGAPAATTAAKPVPSYTPPPPVKPQVPLQAPPYKPKSSAISVTHTSNNAFSNTIYDDRLTAVSPYVPSGARLPPPSPTRSPIIAKRVPTRMSPVITPSSYHMNPAAMEFIPSGLGSHGLEALPTSTAEMDKPSSETKPTSTFKPTPIYRRSATSSPAIAPFAGSNIIEGKTIEEIRAIKEKSSLSKNAPAYTLKRTMNRMVLQPSPLTLKPSSATPSMGEDEPDLSMLLDDLWCLFYLPLHGENIKEETYNPTLVFRMDSIPTFWKVMNNIPIPTDLPYCTLYMFRDGIDPRWEDKMNRDGGMYRIKINHNRNKYFNSLNPTANTSQNTSDSKVNEAWELLLCRTIGDSWSPEVRNTINGVALKVRERSYSLEIWVTRDTAEIKRDIATLLHDVLGSAFVLNYFSHASLQERSHQLEEQNKKKQQQIQKQNSTNARGGKRNIY